MSSDFDDGFITATCIEQQNVEQMVAKAKQESKNNSNGIPTNSGPRLLRDQHVKYILRCLNHLPSGCMGMDASRSWFCFWAVHSLRMLHHKLDNGLIHRILSFLRSCQSKEGGFAGAPGQLPHLATTYASVMALVEVGTAQALDSINRPALRAFIASMRQPNGSFSVHRGGETDVRAAYCALAVAQICCLPNIEELFADTPAWFMRCQSYEGGFGGEPGCEAHGGYNFCALAGLALMGKTHLVNVDAALRWSVYRQMRMEGGFQGRTNKLVDVCYSYWQAACFSALDCQINNGNGQKWPGNLPPLFDVPALQSYVLEACQCSGGGLRDKPDKHPDMYHTCYALSGLAIAQFYGNEAESGAGNSDEDDPNFLEPIHPLFNVTMVAYEKAISHFSSKNEEGRD